jgi:hypothetical protein
LPRLQRVVEELAVEVIFKWWFSRSAKESDTYFKKISPSTACLTNGGIQIRPEPVRGGP